MKNASPRKSFEQACPLARAMDVIGDRWTVLVMRELLGGPARFQDLVGGLPGVARNLLTTRLRRLETDGLVVRQRRHGVVLYQLTEHGLALRPALEALGFWGAGLTPLAPARHRRSLRAVAMALHAIVSRRPPPAQPYVVAMNVADETVRVALGPAPQVLVGPAPSADVAVRVSLSTLRRYLSGEPVSRRDFDAPPHQAVDALFSALGVPRALPR